MMRKTVIAVGSFRGGAETVGRYGSSRRSDFYHQGLTDQEIDRLASPWGGTGLNAAFVVKAMEDVHLAAALARVSAQLLYRVSILMALALLLWVLGLVAPFMVDEWSDRWNFALLFPTVMAAGTLGAAVQTLRGIRGGRTNSGRVIVVDIMLGVAAGMIAAILYLLAQIGISGTVDVEMSSADYARVSIIVSMASLFAALYLDSAFERFDTVGGSVISGNHKDP